MKVCLIDAFHPNDPALVNSHWVAERTASFLRTKWSAQVELLAGDDAHAASVGSALEQPFEGYAYFGHGRQHVLYRDKTAFGEPVPLVGSAQISLLGARWFHAFACLSGVSLCPAAANAGASAYLGYRVQVVVEWDIQNLPEELVRLLEELVTVATLALAEGYRSRDTIRRKVRDVSDRFLDWMDVNADACSSLPWIQNAGLQKLANLLHQDLVLEGVAVVP